jgi:hypothetical protein
MISGDHRFEPTRRGFLTLLTHGLVATAFWQPFRGRRRPAAASQLEEAILETLSDLPMRSSSARIGRSYLDERPGEASSSKLLRDLARRVRAADAAAEPNPSLGLTRAIRADFDRGELVNVGGWLLSVTEARALALISLL